MSTSTLLALGRPVGKFDTDANGAARYSFKLEVPRGIGYGNEPELSFEYSQGAPNGSLGTGWALGGESAIRLGPSMLAHDGANVAPAGFDLFALRYSLDGNLLLNIKGEYFGPEAEYRTEIDSLERVVSISGEGFVVRESTGRRSEYGTSADSRVSASNGLGTQEWRLKKRFDPHGNCVTYYYSELPATGISLKDITNGSYISRIEYTSNINTGLAAKRLVSFEYITREDPVIQSICGRRSVWGHVLKAVHIGLVDDPTNARFRSYILDYKASQGTKCSYLSSISEVGYQVGQEQQLDPTLFTYNGLSTPDFKFETSQKDFTALPDVNNAAALMNLNISGRSLADFACFRYDNSAKRLSVKTFLANRTGKKFANEAVALQWQAATGPATEADLPFIDVSMSGFPDMLGADLNGDGRFDMVMPYEKNNAVQFAVAHSVGKGFRHFSNLSTNLDWQRDSKFMVMDLTGRGTNEVVQIYRSLERVALTVYPAIEKESGIALQAGKTLLSKQPFEGTIEWLQVLNQRNGSRSLVRVWQDQQQRLKATAFVLDDPKDPMKGFKESGTSVLDVAASFKLADLSVLSCDINGDGVQDIVLCSIEQPGDKIVFKFQTFLGDGIGSFARIGNIVEKKFNFPPAKNEGRFHVTNFGGSVLPELTYIYQQANSRDIVAFIARSSSTGIIGEMTSVQILKNVPLEGLHISVADLNGNGSDDILIHTVAEGVARVLPVYNVNNTSEYMRSITDPIGLKTDITYGPLSDPAIYQSSIAWDLYDKPKTDALPIIAAADLVVSSVTHTNDLARNSLPFRFSISKFYRGARMSRLGRGWQGFEAIRTTNSFEHDPESVVEETYEQKWPLTGYKIKIDTRPASGEVVKSEKMAYKHSSERLGPWNIFRTDRTLEQTDMLEKGQVIRSTGVTYVSDAYGNTTKKGSFEARDGVVINQSWEHSTYTSINGVNGLPVSRKLSSHETTANPLRFEDGDLTLEVFEYQPGGTTLKNKSEWSTDTQTFSTTLMGYDGYGNETLIKTDTGLTITTMYDAEFQTFPVLTIQEGQGLQHTRMSAYSASSGLEVARRDTNGSITCFAHDAFGRCIESRVISTDEDSTQPTAAKFLGDQRLAADEALLRELSSCQLDPSRNMEFQRVSSTSGDVYPCVKSTSHFHEGTGGSTELLEAVNCMGMVSRRISKEGDLQKTLRTWRFNQQGAVIFEGYPSLLSPGVQPAEGLQIVSDPDLGRKIVNDVLGRPLEVVRPRHGKDGGSIITRTEYLKGGAEVKESTFVLGSTPGSSEELISVCSKFFVHIAGEEHISELVDENRLKTTFRFDVAGRLLSSTDAGNNTESRTYNNKGDVVTLNNTHNNMTGNSQVPGITKIYDVSGQLVEENNLLGERITYRYDAKGRPLKKSGHDGRTHVYTYDENGFESLSSVKIFSSSSENSLESSFVFQYDKRGRTSTRTISIANGPSFTTTASYNWQDHDVKTHLPSGAVLTKGRQGNLVSSLSLDSPSSQGWNVKADLSRFNAFEKPEICSISGTDFADNFSHEYTYDGQGFPLSHSVKGISTLVENQYTYGDLDQLARVHESVSGKTIEYGYAGKRLASSQVATQPRTEYAYDNSGNMTQRGTTSISHSSTRSSGIRDGKSVFEVEYDQAGRMINRITPASQSSFAYNSFGNMESITSTTDNDGLQILTDMQGHTLVRAHPDGRREVVISSHYVATIYPDGRQSIRYALRHGPELLASVTADLPISDKSTTAKPRTTVHYSDTKHNITHSYHASNHTLQAHYLYDDYGLLENPADAVAESDISHEDTYEGKYFYEKAGILDFGARWYDPLVGRFTTPDPLTSHELLHGIDGMNRHAFENNDPINHTDPTGYWSWNVVLGSLAGIGLIVAGVALTALTGGAAAPLLAVIVSGALTAGGTAGIFYSLENANEYDAGKFWGGWGVTVGINAAIGAVTAGLGSGITAATKGSGSAARLARLTNWAVDSKKIKALQIGLFVGAKSVMGGVAGVFAGAGKRKMQNLVYGKNNDVWGGAAEDFSSSARNAFFSGVAGELADKFKSGVTSTVKDSYQTWKDPGFSNIYDEPGVWEGFFKNSGNASSNIGQSIGNSNMTGNAFKMIYSNPFK